jgi:hypothetical protein
MWKSCFWHPEHRLLLTVYVDDFKLSGPKDNLAKGWALIRKGIKTDKPKPSGRYLGCQHNVREGPNGGSIEWEVKDFMKQCCVKYQSLAGDSFSKLVPSSTPFLDDSSIKEGDDDEPGELGDEACSILMKILYGARIARYDLLRATCGLAGLVTKWTRACDKKLYKLVCYINSTLDLVLSGWINDPPSELYLKLFADADFAGCEKTSRSTSGVFLCLCGPNSFVPLGAVSKKQSCVSHSTPESELVAADLAIRAEGLPALSIWETILGRQVKLSFQEDNQAAIVVLKSGYSTALRHMGRTHKVCLRWLHERVVENDVELNYCMSADQAADIFTKAFTDPAKWDHAVSNIGVRKPQIASSVEVKTQENVVPVNEITTEDVHTSPVAHSKVHNDGLLRGQSFRPTVRVNPPSAGGQEGRVNLHNARTTAGRSSEPGHATCDGPLKEKTCVKGPRKWTPSGNQCSQKGRVGLPEWMKTRSGRGLRV